MAIALSGSSDANNIAGTSSHASSENKRNEGEMVGGCSVCPSDQGTDDNPLVYCDGCEMAVHQACYGIVTVPEGPWYCRKCESGGNQNKAKCALCPSGDGALKKTDNGKWAHVICGLYIPEVRFGNNNTMEPIEIRYIKPFRLNKKCYLCEEGGNSTMAEYGAVVDCSEPGCKQSFHVTCGQSADLLCEKPVKDRDDVLLYVGYCEHHFRKTKAANNRKSTNSNNNSSSSNLDTAGDSSQDNDSRCNITGQDKNSNPKTRFPAVPTLPVSSASNQVEVSNTAAQDVYKWSSSSKEDMTNEKNPLNGKTNSRKKPTTTNTQSPVIASTTATTAAATIASSSSLSTIAANSQSSTITNYSTNKIGSPNPSSTNTSLSSTSPSNSTATTSSLSSSSSSSSSSTSSNSPSPALLSPNVSNRKSSSVRVESPLASNHKTGSSIDLHNKTPQESNSSSAKRPPQGQNSIQTRINIDSPKKNSSTSSSLLSTAVPIPLESTTDPILGFSVTTTDMTGSNTVSATLALTPSIRSGDSNLLGGTSTNASSSLTGQTSGAFNGSTQPSAPPLAISTPPSTSNSTTNSTMKSTAKSKANVKVTRKKSTEANESQPKPEIKPKASRAKKTPAASVISSNNAESTPKTETKRGKGKAAAKPTATSSISPNAPEGETSTSKAKAAAPTKRKSRTASVEAAAATSGVSASPTKRPRKKKADQIPKQNSQTPLITNSSNLPTSNIQPLSATSNIQIGTNPLMINSPNTSNNRLLQVLNSGDGQDMSNRYFSPMISPYANFEHLNAPSLTRSSLSRLFTSSSVNNNNQTNPADDPTKAFEELRENTWSHLSKCVLEQAQQFDIPSLIGTLYSLRSENEKLVNKVRDLTSKRDQLVAMNARLEMPGPMLTQHLNNTSPNFSSVVSGLSNSPKSLPTPSPGSTVGKQPHISVGSFNHVPPGSICPGFLDRSSPLVSQTHSGLNNIKSSSISTPSPPISALMAHSNNNRAGLISANSSFMPNVFPTMNTLSQLGTNSQSSSFYPRQ